MINNIKKYFLPLNGIPFKDIISLEDFEYNFIECQEVRIDDLFMEGAAIITVFNSFHKNKNEKNSKNPGIFFGPLLSQHLSNRGKLKCVLKEVITEKIDPEKLPHFKFKNSTGKYFLTKNGKYAGMYGEEIEKEKVSHLEGIHIYGDWLLKLRVVVELLKRNVNKGIISLTEDDYKNIAHLVLRAEPSLVNCEESIFDDAVNNWIPSMLEAPLIENIPIKMIGRAKEYLR